MLAKRLPPHCKKNQAKTSGAKTSHIANLLKLNTSHRSETPKYCCLLRYATQIVTSK